MRKPEVTKEQQLLEKLIRGGRTKLSEWFEKIIDDFCEEQAVEDITSVETVKDKILHISHRTISVFPTDLAIQILDRERSRPHH